MNETKCVTVIPPCWNKIDRWYNIETGKYFDPPAKPVYVRINGRKREAKRWLELWRLIARIQTWLMQYTQRNA